MPKITSQMVKMVGQLKYENQQWMQGCKEALHFFPIAISFYLQKIKNHEIPLPQEA